MKIRKLQLKNIGVFDDEEIVFEECKFNEGKETKDRKAEIHILTGENGSGKTTILESLIWNFGNKEVTQTLNEGKFKVNSITNASFNKKLRSQNVVIFLSIDTDDSSELAKLKNYSKLTDFQADVKRLNFAAFAYSGYRRIKDEPIEIGKEMEGNPLYQALDFIKDENSKFNVNQWLGQNLLNNSLAQTKKKLDEAKIFDEKIKRFEKVINDIIVDETKDNKIRFEMQSATKLVLIKNEQELDFDVLPDGLKSLISWIGDLLMRLDSLRWKDDTPIFDREIILFLDEIEVHLHPTWQRKVLPIVQKLFKNAQIFVSTHSPFVVNSVDDAWVYKLKLDDNGKATIEEPVESENSNSITQVLREVFGIEQWFGLEVQNTFEDFKKLKHKLISNGTDKVTEEEFLEKARSLADEPNDQLKQMVRKELEELSEIKKKAYKL
jgi:predicted ATP-binding protein involved in virulence